MIINDLEEFASKAKSVAQYLINLEYDRPEGLVEMRDINLILVSEIDDEASYIAFISIGYGDKERYMLTYHKETNETLIRKTSFEIMVSVDYDSTEEVSENENP